MQAILHGGRGLRLLVRVNSDLMLAVSAVLLGLIAGGWMGTLGLN